MRLNGGNGTNELEQINTKPDWPRRLSIPAVALSLALSQQAVRQSFIGSRS